MRKNNFYEKLRGFTIMPVFLLLILFAISSTAIAQKKPPPPKDAPPPPPPPPPPIPEGYTGPGSTLSAATLKKIETLKTIFGQKLSTIRFTGNRENDFLVKVMQLNYGAINNVAEAELGISATNNELANQTDLFFEANALLSPGGSVDSAAGISTFKTSMEKRRLNEIKDELVRISEEYKRSGMDPSVLSFATKIIKSSGKKEDTESL
jgi:hypothetical protein